MSVPDFTTIHPAVFEIFQSGSKWRTTNLTIPKAASVSNKTAAIIWRVYNTVYDQFVVWNWDTAVMWQAYFSYYKRLRGNQQKKLQHAGSSSDSFPPKRFIMRERKLWAEKEEQKQTDINIITACHMQVSWTTDSWPLVASERCTFPLFLFDVFLCRITEAADMISGCSVTQQDSGFSLMLCFFSQISPVASSEAPEQKLHFNTHGADFLWMHV